MVSLKNLNNHLEFDPLKSEYARHNAAIYGAENNVQIINKDFLALNIGDIQFPAERHGNLDVIYMSPPWGGLGYNLVPEYSLAYLYPDFKKVIRKALEFSRNLIIFLPKNTSVEELIEYLIDFAPDFAKDPQNWKNELMIEIEQIIYGASCKGIHIYTGSMA